MKNQVIKPHFKGKVETVTPQKAAELAEKLATYSDGEGYTPAQLLMACQHLAACLVMHMEIKEHRK